MQFYRFSKTMNVCEKCGIVMRKVMDMNSRVTT